jgi:gliding motility-associated-like protein
MENFSKLFLSICLILFGIVAISQPVVSFTASESVACAPANITFTNTTTGCTGAETYLWAAGTGDVSNNENPVFNYSVGGVYTVSLTVTCDGFVVPQTMVITIFDPPIAAFSDVEMHGCNPYNAGFEDLSTIGDAPIDTWLWYFGDGTTGSTQDPSHNYITSGSYNVSLFVTDQNDCTTQVTHNGVVQVANDPVVSFQADNPTWCTAPHTVNFTSSVTTSFGLGSTLVWDFGDGSAVGSGASPTHIYSSTGVYDVTLTVTDDYGCETIVVIDDYIRVTEAVPEYSVLEGTVVCLGEDVHFVNETGYSCLWNFGDGATSTQSTPIHVYNTTGDMSVTFTVDPGGPCEESTTFNLLVEQVIASYTTTPANLFSCTTPFTVNFTNTSTSNGTSFFYLFQDGGSSTSEDPSHTYNSTGVYQPTLTVTTVSGCFHTYIGPVITINSPSASFTGDTIEGCEPLLIDFTYNGTTPIGSITNWSWNFDNGQTIPSGTNTSSSTFAAGEYTVTLTVTDNNSCTNSATLDILVGTVYVPNIDVFDNDEDHTPLPDHFICAQDTVALWVEEWDNDDFELTWWIDSSSNQDVSEEFTEHAFDQDTGWVYLHMITLYNGCRDTILWDSLYISGPIIRGISYETECSSPRDYIFSVDTLLASNWDWEIYNWSGPNESFLSTSYGSTDVDYPFTFPPTPNSFWIRVTAYNDTTGCVFVDSLQITITAPQAIFAIIDDERCVDEDITFFGGTSVNAAEYYWDYGDGTNSGWSTNATSVHAYSTVDFFTVTLRVRDANGCEDFMDDEIHIMGPEIHISADEIFGCNSLAVTFTENIITDDPISWVMWEFGDGEHTFGTGTIDPHTYLSAGVYSVTVTAHTVNGCETSEVYTDYITVAEVTAFFSAPVQAACVNDSISFAAIETNTSYVYTWNFGEGSDVVGNNPTPSHTYTAGGYYDVYLEVNNGLGCVSELLLDDYITIQEPIANFSIVDNNPPCYPVEPEIITNNSVFPVGTPLYYEWIMGTNDTIDIEDPEYLYTIPGNFTIILNLSTPLGCTATYSQAITINGPYAEALISDTSACVGQDITFEIINQQNVDEFIWVVGGGDSYTDEVFTHSYDLVPPEGYFPVNLSMTSGSCNVIFVYNVYIYQVVAGMTITDPGSIVIDGGACSPFDGVLTSLSTNDDFRYWYINGIPYGAGGSTEPHIFTNNTATDQTVNVSLAIEDIHGCYDSISYSIDVYALPQVTITQDTVICFGDAITIYATGGVNYVWSPNESISAVNIQSPVVDPETDITYYVDVYNARNCVRSDSVHIAVQQEPTITLTQSTDTVIIGDSVTSLLVSDQDGLSFDWTPQEFISCYDCPSPVFYPEESMRYNLTVEDSAQCFRYNYYIDIVVIEQYTLDVPGAFTPLGSEGNRIVYANGYGIRELLQFRIYNRWGEEVFFTDDIKKGWDGYYNGQLQNIDNYSYYVEAEMYNGTIQSKKGQIMLIR